MILFASISPQKVPSRAEAGGYLLRRKKLDFFAVAEKLVENIRRGGKLAEIFYRDRKVDGKFQPIFHAVNIFLSSSSS